MAHTCTYVLVPGTPETKAVYCGLRVEYTNPINRDSGVRERKYNSFCRVHQIIVDATPDEDE